METKKIFTESPEDEQWRMLLYFTYPNNIKQHFDKLGITNPPNELPDRISGSISQAKEYFDATKASSLQIAPLLLYYGVTNLFDGILSLTSGNLNTISDHGMRLKIPNNNCSIADLEVTPRNPKTGALSVFNRSFSPQFNICETGMWKVIELFSSIPDIFDDFVTCYASNEPHVIPIYVIKERNSVIEQIESSVMQRFSSYQEALSRVIDYKLCYLPFQGSLQTKDITLRQKMNAEEIGVHALSGYKYLQLAHKKNGHLVCPSMEIVMFMVLYSLGFISRYHPQIWNPFVRNDISGEKLLIEKFLFYSRRILPNLALNYIYQKRICFVTESQGMSDLSRIIPQEEIQEISRQEVRKVLEREKYRLK